MPSWFYKFSLYFHILMINNNWMNTFAHVFSMFLNLIKFLSVGFMTQKCSITQSFTSGRDRRREKQLHLPPKFFQFSDKQFNSTRPMIWNNSFIVNKCILTHLWKHCKPRIICIRYFWCPAHLLSLVSDSSHTCRR